MTAQFLIEIASLFSHQANHSGGLSFEHFNILVVIARVSYMGFLKFRDYFFLKNDFKGSSSRLTKWP